MAIIYCIKSENSEFGESTEVRHSPPYSVLCTLGPSMHSVGHVITETRNVYVCMLIIIMCIITCEFVYMQTYCIVMYTFIVHANTCVHGCIQCHVM